METLQLPEKAQSFTAGYFKTKHVRIKELKPLALQNFDKLNIADLTDYIITTHHSYIKKNASIVYDLAQKVAYKHSENHPELLQLISANFFFFHDLLNHLAKEEQILFPHFKQLAQSRNFKGTGTYANFNLIKGAVRVMHKEHQAINAHIKLFHQLTHDYTLPSTACYYYKDLFKKMKEFEDNVALHIHLENDILFPKAVAMAEKLQEEKINKFLVGQPLTR